MKTIRGRVGVAVVAGLLCAPAAGWADGPTVELLSGVEEQPGWAVSYGREFWQGLAVEEEAADAGAGRPRTLDDVMERIAHAIKPEAEGAVFVVRAKAYSAWFDAEGFRLSSLAGRVAGDLAFRTRSVSVGTNFLFDAGHVACGTGRRVVLCNTAQVLLNEERGLVEHVEARSRGLAVTWILRQHALVAEELVVRAEIERAVFVCATSAGFHFSDTEGGRDFLLRRAVATDRRGWRWPVAMSAETGGVVLKLTSRCMREAYRPLVIETRIEPSVAFGSGEPVKAGAPASAVRAADVPAAQQVQASNEGVSGAVRGEAVLEPIPSVEYHATAASSFRTADELVTLAELRDLLVMFYGLAWSQVNDGIPHDRDTIAAQAESWAYLADSREKKGRRDFEAFLLHVERSRALLGSYADSACRDSAWRLSRTIENFTLLPFTHEGESESCRLEQGIRAQLPVMYHGFRAQGEEPIPIFTTLRAALHDAGMFHFYVTAALATRAGVAADWAARLADYDAHSNEYAAARGPLFARNVAVPRSVAALGEATDAWLERIRTGTDVTESFRVFDGRMRELCAAVRNAPMSWCGDKTIAAQLAKVRLAYSELLNARLDLSGYSSPAFNGAKVEARLASIEGKLRAACDEAGRQLTVPDEAAWPMLGIASSAEAKAVLKQRRILAEKFGAWLRLLQDWRAALARQPDNNFATLNFLTSFVRNKAEWDHLMATEVYPVAWHYPPLTVPDALARQDFPNGTMVEANVNAMLADLQDVWTCYGDY